MFRQQRKCRDSPVAPWRPCRSLVSLGVAVAVFLASSPALAQDFPTQEYRAKARYLAKFPSSVEWPEAALPPGDAPFLLCVFGDHPFGLSLAEFTREGSRLLALAPRVVTHTEAAKS